MGTSFANTSDQVTAYSYTAYAATDGTYFADLQGLSTGIATSQFTNASGQAGTVGSILERAITLNSGAHYSFDWAFLAGDMSDWNDFALFYLKNQSGVIVFSMELAQIGSAPPVPIPSSVLLLGTGLIGLLGLGRRSKRRVG